MDGRHVGDVKWMLPDVRLLDESTPGNARLLGAIRPLPFALAPGQTVVGAVLWDGNADAIRNALHPRPSQPATEDGSGAELDVGAPPPPPPPPPATSARSRDLIHGRLMVNLQFDPGGWRRVPLDLTEAPLYRQHPPVPRSLPVYVSVGTHKHTVTSMQFFGMALATHQPVTLRLVLWRADGEQALARSASLNPSGPTTFPVSLPPGKYGWGLYADRALLTIGPLKVPCDKPVKAKGPNAPPPPPPPPPGSSGGRAVYLDACVGPRTGPPTAGAVRSG